jgi:tRNA nucleotidyltransferase (CCA-adding enzyme)
VSESDKATGGTHVILTHEHADFDAVASLLGAALLMPDAVPVLPRRVNRNVTDFLTIYGGQLPFADAETLPRRRVTSATLVDTQSAQYPRGMGPETQIQVIDHHPLARDDVAPGAYLGGETGACTTLLVEEVCRRAIDITPIEATLLLLGIYEDTGSLTYRSTTSRDLQAGAWLLEQGANLEVGVDFLHHPLTSDQRDLYHALVDNATTHKVKGHTVVIATAVAPDLDGELSTVAHKLRELLEPAALFVLVDLGDHLQLVARSTTDAISVGDVAAELGGGGHNRAAAAMIDGLDTATVADRILQLLEERIQPLHTVREIMSHGAVRTFEADTTVAAAARQMRRYGHEGYPVVRDGEVVGILLRREVDRALHHGLNDTPIDAYMHKGAITIRPEASVEELRELMMQHDVGQVAVVDDGQMIGIVTRTDLLKLWGQPEPVDRAAEIISRLESAVSSALLELLKSASEIAAEQMAQLYVVGGFVRDLLLGVTHGPDIDLVVDGDAVALARALCDKYAGRVRSHSRFGTAKWILPPAWASRPGVPASLDFVTARTEFYESPTALPSVERGSIKSDLRRRDFTINTLAINLSPDHYGQLLDFFGGEADLRAGLIRVLHNLSLVEDPTRILRAARLAERLEFEIESRTRELIDDAVDLLERVSGDRIRHELFAIFEEQHPERMLDRLNEFGALQAMHPGLVFDAWIEDRFAGLPDDIAEWYRMSCREPHTQASPPPTPARERARPAHYLALLAYRMTAKAVEELTQRLQVSSDVAGLVRQMPRLREVEARLRTTGLMRSDVYHALEGFDADALGVLWVATSNSQVRAHLAKYQSSLQCMEPAIDGYDLQAMGVKPGPIYRALLAAVRDARLNGEVTSRAGELAVVRRILTEREIPFED